MSSQLVSNLRKEAGNWLSANFPRLLDLYEHSDQHNPKNYFNVEFPLPLGEEEKRLARLDTAAWGNLRDKAVPYVSVDDPVRSYQQLWSTLDEARGYVLLADQGYDRIEFIEPDNSKERGKQSPDLIGFKFGSVAIVEVKTINESGNNLAADVPWRKEAVVVPKQLSEEFKRKILSTIDQAKNQLLSFPRQTDRKIVLLVIRFDYGLKTGGHLYGELERFISSLTPESELEVYHQPTLR
jgi:hypothetical protein